MLVKSRQSGFFSGRRLLGKSIWLELFEDQVKYKADRELDSGVSRDGLVQPRGFDSAALILPKGKGELMTISREAYFEDLLSVKNLKRPSNLAKVVVDLSTKECNDEADPKSFVEKFQLLLNCASSKENFAFNGGTVQGCCSPELSELMAGRGEVWLFSTEECLPKENWIEFYPYGEAIARG